MVDKKTGETGKTPVKTKRKMGAYDKTYSAELAADTGARLRVIRAALGMNASTFAESLGAAPNRYSHWENGKSIIPQTKALIIRKLYGVTLDYIYTGDMAAMPLELVKKISAIDSSAE